MPKRTVILTLCLFFSGLTGPAAAAKNEALISLVRQACRETVISISEDAGIIDAVREANKSADKSGEEIGRLDKKWRSTDGIDDWIGSFLNNPAAEYLRKIQEKSKREDGRLIAEIFLMDKQGNIIAETDKSSDYQQGDEDKFTEAFLYKKGFIYVEDAMFDESTGRYLIHVSAPVIDTGAQKAIGVVCAGIDIDILMERSLY